jgi:O6-methylguanine-DNA--protein-cysteine methyltransferase
VAPAAAPTQPSSDEEHIARLRDFFSDHRPDSVDQAQALFKKLREKIWEELEKRYTGKTAKYTEVCCCVAYDCGRLLRV